MWSSAVSASGTTPRALHRRQARPENGAGQHIASSLGGLQQVLVRRLHGVGVFGQLDDSDTSITEEFGAVALGTKVPCSRQAMTTRQIPVSRMSWAKERGQEARLRTLFEGVVDRGVAEARGPAAPIRGGRRESPASLRRAVYGSAACGLRCVLPAGFGAVGAGRAPVAYSPVATGALVSRAVVRCGPGCAKKRAGRPLPGSCPLWGLCAG